MFLFVTGIEEKYPNSLIKDSPIIEGNVIACLWKQPTLYEDWKLEPNDFITQDGQVYFQMGLELHQEGFRIFDLVTVTNYLENKKALSDWFNTHGGYRAVEEMITLINLDNSDKYYDDINKRNILLSLYDKGFEVVNNLDKFKKLNSEMVYQYYDLQLNNVFVKKQLGVKMEKLIIDDNFIERCNNGDEMGMLYNKFCPLLSYTTLGIHKRSLYVLAGYSGTGKTSFACANYILPLLEQGKKVCIVSNEQNIDEYKRLLLGTVISNVTGYYDMTRKDLQKGGFKNNPEHWKAVKQSQDFWNKYQDNIMFVKLYDYDMNSVKKVVNTLSKQGFELFIYDTFKSDDLSSNTATGDLVEDSKKLFRIADKENVAIVLTMQLAIWTLDKRYLNAGCLSTAKGVKEVCSELILMRSLWEDEYSGEGHDVRGFYKKKIEGTDSYKKELITTYKDSKYQVIFIDKTRSGETDVQLLYKVDMQWNKWQELGWCTSGRF